MSVRNLRVWAMLLCAVVLFGDQAFGQATELQKLLASDGAAFDRFGHDVAVDGNWAVVGAPYHDGSGAQSGTVYVYQFNGTAWIEKQVLNPNPGSINDLFGFSVDISGNTIVVGAPKNDQQGIDSGIAFSYEKQPDNTWILNKTFNDVQSAGDEFGTSVAIDGDYAVFGAPHANNSAGRAYVHERTGAPFGGPWDLSFELNASDAFTGDNFGRSVSISGNQAIVGAFRNSDAGSDSGSAYVFEKQGGPWVEVVKFTASDAGPSEYFGWSVSIFGDQAIVGAFWDDDAGSDSGSVYVFEKQGGTWGEVVKLTALDAAVGDYFGYSVSISDDVAIVGATQNDDVAHNTGSAYVYEKQGSTWVQVDKLTASDAVANDSFGFSVSISGDQAIIGARNRDDDNGPDSGSAYIFDLSGQVAPPALATLDGFGFTNRTLASNPASPSFEVGMNAEYIGDATDIARVTLSTPSGILADSQAPGSSFSTYGTTVSLGASQLSQSDIVFPASYTIAFEFTNGATQEIVVPISEADIPLPALTTTSPDPLSTITDSTPLISWAPYISNGRQIADPTLTTEDYNFNLTVSQETPYLPVWSYSTGFIHPYSATSVIYNFDGTATAGYETLPPGVYNFQYQASEMYFRTIEGSSALFWRFAITQVEGVEVVEPTPPTPPTTPTEIAKLLASDGAANDRFGNSVSIDGDRAIVGAYRDGDAGTDSGSAYVFEKQAGTWVQVDKLTASDVSSGDFFGSSVSISGDQAIVGAAGDDDAGTNSGSVYVYEKQGGTWVQVDKLTASDAASGDFFGNSVSISGDQAIVGASNDDAGSDSGSAYVYEKQAGTWVQVDKLTASDAAAGDRFGVSVSISGDQAIVGAYLDDDAGSNSGSAYVYEKQGGTWVQVDKLTASDAASDDQFGFSVSISGDQAIVGARFDDDAGASSGSAYVYEKQAGIWVQVDKLTASDGAFDDQFGCSVSISGDQAIVGAFRNDDAGNDSGSAYVYEKQAGNWVEVDKLTASDGATNDNFGASLALDFPHVIIGASEDDDNGYNSGSVYIFDLGAQVSPGTAELTLSPTDAIEPGATQEYCLEISEASGVIGYRVALSYDSSKVSYATGSATIVGTSTSSGWLAPEVNSATPGLLLFTSASEDSALSSGEATLLKFSLQFAPTLDEADTIDLTFDTSLTSLNDGAIDVTPVDVTIPVVPINDAPFFTPGGNVTVLEDSGSYSQPWATGIDSGAPEEASQSVTFTVTSNSNPALFSLPPAISPTGELTFVPAPDANGFAELTVILQDDGGTQYGGQDTSAPVTFFIIVDAVNDPPSFTKGLDIVVDEDSGVYSEIGWATNIIAGPVNEATQTLSFVITDFVGNLVFASSPTISATGTLEFEAAADANGVASVTAVLVDDGGTANGGIDSSTPANFYITVLPINDAPTLDPIPAVSILEDSTPFQIQLTGISNGDPESSQSVFISAATSAGLLSVFPIYDGVSDTADLFLSPLPDANGVETVTVTAVDDGAFLPPDVNITTRDLIVSITPVNDAPSFLLGADQNILNDGGITQSVPGWASAITAGPTDEASQALTFSINDPSSVLSSVSVDATGTLYYAAAAGAHGIADVSIALNDDGGSANGGIPSSATEDFRINVFLPFLWGDLDDNSVAGAVDASLLLRWDAELISEFPGYPIAEFPEYFRDDPTTFPPAADVDNSGSAGTLDASLILRKFVFLIDRFPADTNGDDIGPDPYFYTQTAVDPVPRMLEVYVEAMPSDGAGNFRWALTFLLDDATNVSGLRLGLNYDPSVASVVENSPQWLIPGGLLVANTTQPGRIILSGALTEPLGEGRQELIRLEIEGTSAEPPVDGVLVTVDDELTRINDGQVILGAYSLQEFSLGLETHVTHWMLH